MPGFFVRFEDLNMSKKHPIVIPDDPVPVAAGIGWCENRHEKSTLTKVLTVLSIIYHIEAACYAVQVAEVGINNLKVIIRGDGYVDWLFNSEADAYRERYLKMESCNMVSTLGRDKALRLADIWIQEHRDIESGVSSEQDFAPGRPYVNKGVVYRK
jgi:hypothetical protein